MTHPYMPLYVDDFEAATTHLSIEEDGLYNRLLRLCWRTPGCSIPNDAAWIARKVRMSLKDYERVSGPVIEEFFKVQRGRLFQKRLKAEYENISRKKLSRAKAGKSGGDAKALKSKENMPSNATDLLGHTRAFPEPEPEPEEANASLSPPKRSVGDARRGSRIPDDWTPSKDCNDFALAEGLTPQETARAAAEFRDYWRGRTGRDATKLDWPATWRNRVRAIADRKRPPLPLGGSGAGRNGPKPVSMAGILAERRRQAPVADDVPDDGWVLRAG